MTTLDIVIPLYNEELGLPKSIKTLRSYLSQQMSVYQWRIVIADNGSTDSTLDVAKDLSNNYSGLAWIHLEQKGRGRALFKTWSESQADIICYMDVDLSTPA